MHIEKFLKSLELPKKYCDSSFDISKNMLKRQNIYRRYWKDKWFGIL